MIEPPSNSFTRRYDFFIDRTRSGRYFVNIPMAHRELLNGCTSVIEKVLREGQRLDRMGCGWGDAYEYACQNLEAHRRDARTRSKLQIRRSAARIEPGILEIWRANEQDGIGR